MDGWMDERLDPLLYEWLDEFDEWLYEWLDEFDEWLYQWIDESSDKELHSLIERHSGRQANLSKNLKLF